MEKLIFLQVIQVNIAGQCPLILKPSVTVKKLAINFRCSSSYFVT